MISIRFLITVILLFKVIEKQGNDSLAYRTSFYQFRTRDASKEVSPDQFKLGNYQTSKQRADEQEAKNRATYLSEGYKPKEELRAQVMRPT